MDKGFTRRDFLNAAGVFIAMAAIGNDLRLQSMTYK